MTARRGRTRSKLLVLMLAVVIGGAGLSGCAGLPSTSTVRQGDKIGPPPAAPIRVRVERPRAGASQEQIVRGFLAASLDTEDDSAAPRAFLTGEALKSWDPRAEVVIHAGAPTITRISGTTLRLQATAQALIEPGGRYVEQPAGRVRTADITLSQGDDDQWRITRLPEGFGLWLSRSYAEQAFEPHRVHYLSTASTATQKILVPDVRWLPLVRGGLVTTLARAQLGEVPAYLQEAVRTAIPPRTELSVDTTVVESGTAVVDLSAAFLEASAQDQRGAWAQLLATVTQAPGVHRLALRVDGAPVQLADIRSPVALLTDLGYRGPGGVGVSRLLTRTGTTLSISTRAVLSGVRDHEPGKDSEPTLLLPNLPVTWRSLAMPADLSEIAAVDTAGSVLRVWPTRSGPGARAHVLGRELSPPAYDRHDMLWVAGRDTAGRAALWSIRSGSSLMPTRVLLPELKGDSLAAVRVSADGQRAAVILRSAAGVTRLGLAGVVREAGGRPLRLTSPVRIGGALTEVRDVTWVDDITLGVLGRGVGDKESRPFLVPLGRPSQPLAPVSRPVRVLVAGQGPAQLLVVTETGMVLSRVGSRWREFVRMSDIVVPGT